MKKTIVSKFTNYRSTSPTSINLWDWLHDDSYKDFVYKIRTLSDKDQIRKLKSELPCITPSGQFMLRSATALLEHSGYICIDIDGGDNLHLTDFENVKNELKKVKNISYTALSVSGKGVFCLIRIKYPHKHKEHFEALKIQFSNIGITIDKACADVSRLRGYSYDENAYFNEEAIIFEQVFEYKNTRVVQKEAFDLEKKYGSENTTHSKVMRIINKLNTSRIDITENYEQWFQIGCALANEFGEEGRDMFHLVSEIHSEYKPGVCDTTFSSCLKGGYAYGIGTFFHWAEQYGVS